MKYMYDRLICYQPVVSKCLFYCSMLLEDFMECMGQSLFHSYEMYEEYHLQVC